MTMQHVATIQREPAHIAPGGVQAVMEYQVELDIVLRLLAVLGLDLATPGLGDGGQADQAFSLWLAGQADLDGKARSKFDLASIQIREHGTAWPIDSPKAVTFQSSSLQMTVQPEEASADNEYRIVVGPTSYPGPGRLDRNDELMGRVFGALGYSFAGRELVRSENVTTPGGVECWHREGDETVSAWIALWPGQV